MTLSECKEYDVFCSFHIFLPFYNVHMLPFKMLKYKFGIVCLSDFGNGTHGCAHAGQAISSTSISIFKWGNINIINFMESPKEPLIFVKQPIFFKKKRQAD